MVIFSGFLEFFLHLSGNLKRLNDSFFFFHPSTVLFRNTAYLTYMKVRNHDRASNKTAISVSLPKSLKAKIQIAAAKENRTVSNFITHHLEQFLDHERTVLNSEQAAAAAAKAQQETDPAVQAIIDKAIAAQQRIIDAEQDVRKRA